MDSGYIAARENGWSTYQSYTYVYTRGCITAYGMVGPSGDLAEYAAALLAGRHDLWALAKRLPCIGYKLNLFLKFYHALDPTFTREYLLVFCDNQPVENRIRSSPDEQMFPVGWKKTTLCPGGKISRAGTKNGQSHP